MVRKKQPKFIKKEKRDHQTIFFQRKVTMENLSKKGSEESLKIGLLTHFETELNIRKLQKCLEIVETATNFSEEKNLLVFLSEQKLTNQSFRFNYLDGFEYSISGFTRLNRIYLDQFISTLKLLVLSAIQFLNLERVKNLNVCDTIKSVLKTITFFLSFFCFTVVFIYLTIQLCNISNVSFKEVLARGFSVQKKWKSFKSFNIFFPFIKNGLIKIYQKNSLFLFKRLYHFFHLDPLEILRVLSTGLL